MILAGGEGRRLEQFTTDSHGVRVPKQFCRFRNGRSLLQATIERGLRLVDPEHLLAAVVKEQRVWWEPELAGLVSGNTLVQPRNLGTGVAILHALVHILIRDPAAVVVVLPSDHDVDREDVLRGAIRKAIRVAQRSPSEIMLLGTTPIEADPEYGWIVPGEARADGTMEVESFTEKPGMADYERLRRRGAMCNTFVLVATVRAMCQRYCSVRPGLLKKFLWRLRWHEQEDEALENLHATAPCLDFGRDLLEPSARSLRLVPVPPCGWADLGTPARLQAWARAMRMRVGANPLVLWVPDCGGALSAVPIGSPA